MITENNRLNINCISLQSKRNQRFMKILPYYKNINLKEEIAIDGNDKNTIIKLKKEMNITFDNNASDNNQALFLKSVILWESFLNSNESYLLIIEDDVVPTYNINEKINIINKELPKDFDICVLMGVNFGNPTEFSKSLYGKTNFSCIGAYLLSKDGAKKLINLAKENKILTHSSGGVLDYWINLQKDQLNFYKSKEDLFYLLNIPSSLAVSRNKIIEKYLPKVDRFLSNNYIITITLNYFTNINGKITITYYLFFDLFVIYILKTFTNDIISFLILLLFTLVDIFVNRYLLEEIVNKFLEFILSFSLLIFLFEIVNLK